MNITQKTFILSSLALGVVALVSPVVFAETVEISGNGSGSTNTITVGNTVTVHTGSASATPTDCIATDVKGFLNYSGDHMSGTPVTGTFENIAADPDCGDDIYVHVFGSNNTEVNVGDWLDSQVHLDTQKFTIPQGGSQNITVILPTSDYCWYQVDATRTSDVRTPPVYNGTDMIDYVFVKNRDCNVTPTATPSATPTPGSNNGGGGSSSNASSSESPKTVESIQTTMATSTMAPTGDFLGSLMNILFGSGIMVAALGAVSYAKDKKAKLA
jgi:hypothetical protein